MAILNENGHEVLDPMPKSLTIPFRRPEPLHARIRRMILEAVQAQRGNDEVESFEDADDFEVGDSADYEDRMTPYEEHFDHISRTDNDQSPLDIVTGKQIGRAHV